MGSAEDSRNANPNGLHTTENGSSSSFTGLANEDFISTKTASLQSISAGSSMTLSSSVVTNGLRFEALPPAPQNMIEILTATSSGSVPPTALASPITALNNANPSAMASVIGLTTAYEEAKESEIKSITISDCLPSADVSIKKRGRGRPRKVETPVEKVNSLQLQQLVPYDTGNTAPDQTPLKALSILPTPSAAGNAANRLISAESPSTPLLPVKRPRGRPRGSKNKIHVQPQRVERVTTPRSDAVHKGKRRKLSDSRDDEDDEDYDYRRNSFNGEAGSKELDPDATPSTFMTKSGRQVHRPSQFVTLQSPASGNGHGSSSKKRGGRSKLFGANGAFRSVSMGRKTKNLENALCKVCDRGVSPTNNVVVFCDGCGDAYHQYCHHPPINQDVVTQPDKEWLCAKCIRLQEGGLDLRGFINAVDLSVGERRKALNALPREKLVEVLMAVNAVHPEFAIFPSKEYLDGTLPELEEDERMVGRRPEEYYDGYETDPPSHYPRAGCGLARTLPPEQEDIAWLLDDNEEVYSRVTYPSNLQKESSALPGLPVTIEDHVMPD